MSRFKQKRRSFMRKENEQLAINDVLESMAMYHFTSGHANVGSCIQESQIFKMLLKKHYNLNSKLVCSDITIWNNMASSIIEHWNDGNELSEEAEAILDDLESRGCPAPYITECGHDTVGIDKGGYQGHVVVQTEFFVVDVTMGQFNRDRLDPMGHFMVWEKHQFVPFAEHQADWMLKERKNFPTIDREMRDDYGSIKPVKGVIHLDLPPICLKQSDETAVVKVGDWTRIMLQLRPDLNIEETYARWNAKSFREGTRRIVELIGQAGELLSIMQGQNKES
mgnify:FL=1